jgi:hypothetical protein
MTKCYYDDGEGWEQGIRVNTNDAGQIIIEQYDTFNGKATATVVLFLEEAKEFGNAILAAAGDYDSQRERQKELDKLTRLKNGSGLPGGY